MTDLETRIREELRDAHWDLPAWPDPMPRIRRAALLRLARISAVTVGVIAVVAVPVAGVLSVLASQRTSGPPAASSSASSQPHPRHTGVPSFAGRLSGEVAYKCLNEICLMRPDGTARRTLAATTPEWDPAWSPDGRVLAFRGYFGFTDGDYAVYTVRADGCQLKRVPHTLQGATPSWSPTARQIAFVAAGQAGIEIINADGTGLRSLVGGQRSGFYSSPSWSARNLIAFVRARGSGHGQIYTMKPDGTGLTQITYGAGSGDPTWSPSGRLLASVSASGAIEVMRADGSGANTVSPAGWASSDPTWTPNGKLVFLADRGNNINSYVVNPDGTDLRLLNPGLDGAQTAAAQFTWGAATLPAGKCNSAPPTS
ncbi:MAG: hypothetical protein LBV34_15775 [Nocardiopsaceae bacterium]|nr:hypothetical protein [Nocardiopsaceae bacterium]